MRRRKKYHFELELYTNDGFHKTNNYNYYNMKVLVPFYWIFDEKILNFPYKFLMDDSANF